LNVSKKLNRILKVLSVTTTVRQKTAITCAVLAETLTPRALVRLPTLRTSLAPTVELKVIKKWTRVTTKMSPLRQKDIRTGTQQERERIIALAKSKVCFDNRDKGECDHSVCYGMIDLIAVIGRENK
jgi:hypothetical protein